MYIFSGAYFEWLYGEETFPPHITGDIGQIVQEYLIRPYYAQPLPAPDKVMVPFRGKKKLWKNFSRRQKMEVNNFKPLSPEGERFLLFPPLLR